MARLGIRDGTDVRHAFSFSFPFLSSRSFFLLSPFLSFGSFRVRASFPMLFRFHFHFRFHPLPRFLAAQVFPLHFCLYFISRLLSLAAIFYSLLQPAIWFAGWQLCGLQIRSVRVVTYYAAACGPNGHGSSSSAAAEPAPVTVPHAYPFPVPGRNSRHSRAPWCQCRFAAVRDKVGAMARALAPMDAVRFRSVLLQRATCIQL